MAPILNAWKRASARKFARHYSSLRKGLVRSSTLSYEGFPRQPTIIIPPHRYHNRRHYRLITESSDQTMHHLWAS
jgi:hypothetical protein